MRASLLAELSDLFVREATRADKTGKHDEADRFWDIADELHKKAVTTHRAEALNGEIARAYR